MDETSYLHHLWLGYSIRMSLLFIVYRLYYSLIVEAMKLVLELIEFVHHILLVTKDAEPVV